MVQEDELTYLQELKAAHSDPSAEWGGGGGGSYTAGTGITIDDGVLSVNAKSGSGIVLDTDLTDDSLVIMIDQADIPYKSDLATVATTGSYSDLSGTPSLATVATTGSYSDLTGTPNLSVYAEKADYALVKVVPNPITTGPSANDATTITAWVKSLPTIISRGSAATLEGYGFTNVVSANIGDTIEVQGYFAVVTEPTSSPYAPVHINVCTTENRTGTSTLVNRSCTNKVQISRTANNDWAINNNKYRGTNTSLSAMVDPIDGQSYPVYAFAPSAAKTAVLSSRSDRVFAREQFYTIGVESPSGSDFSPAAIPACPTTTDGSYQATATVSSGSVAYTWEQGGGGGGSYTFTNGLTENAGTVSWDLNNYIKTEDSGLIISSQSNENAFRPHGYSVVFGNVVGYDEQRPSYIEAGYTSSSMSNRGGSMAFGSIDSIRSKIKAAPKGSLAFGEINISDQTIEAGRGSLAFGENDNQAGGRGSCAHGKGTKASSNYQTAIGQYNIADSNNVYAFIIGNGSDNSNRSNAMSVAWDGTIVSKNLPAVSGTDGTYQLTATTSSGTTTYSWATGGSGSGKYLHKVKIYANFSGIKYWTEEFVSSSATSYTSVSDYLTDRGYTITDTSDQPTKSFDTYAGTSIEAIAYRNEYGIYISQLNINSSGAVTYGTWSLQSSTPAIQDEVIAL